MFVYWNNNIRKYPQMPNFLNKFDLYQHTLKQRYFSYKRSAICVQHFDDSLIQQFALNNEIRFGLHRYENQDIRCLKLFFFVNLFCFYHFLFKKSLKWMNERKEKNFFLLSLFSFFLSCMLKKEERKLKETNK